MARKLNMVVIIALATMAFLQNSVFGVTYIVGDSSGWAVPPTPDGYSNWAAGKRFVIGDILVFNFAANSHDVAEVTKSGYENCDRTNPIFQQSTSPVSITLRTAGEHYFICTFPGHCISGQSFGINVARALTPSPRPGDGSPSPSPAQVPAFAPTPSVAMPPSAPAIPPSLPTTSPTPAADDFTPPPITAAVAPPPRRNAAASVGVAGFSATFLFGLALALLF